MEIKKSLKLAVLVEVLAIIWMAIEFGVGFFAGIQAHSILLIAFGLDSLLEIAAGVILIWRLLVQLKNKKVDIDKIDKIATKIVSVILLLLCAYVILTSGYNLFTHQGADSSLAGIIISILSLIIMPIFAYIKYRLGKRIGSNALIQDAFCSTTCAYLAATVLLGIVINSLFHIWWIDSAAALLIVILIGKEAFEGLLEK